MEDLEIRRQEWCKNRNIDYSSFCTGIEDLESKICEAYEKSAFQACIIPSDLISLKLHGCIIFSPGNKNQEEKVWGEFYLPTERIDSKANWEDFEEWRMSFNPPVEQVSKPVTNNVDDDFSLTQHYYHQNDNNVVLN